MHTLLRSARGSVVAGLAAMAMVHGCNCTQPGTNGEETTTTSSSSSSSGESGTTSSSGSSSGVSSSGGLGDGGQLPDGSVVGALSVTSISPRAAYRGEDVLVTLFGTGFVDGAVVRFAHQATPQPTGGQFELNGTPASDGTQLTVMLTADNTRPDGLYTVTVVQGADTATLADPFRVTVAPPPSLTDVTPGFAFRGEPDDGMLSDRVLTLTGTGFLTGASVEFLAADQAGAEPVESPDTAVLSSTNATAVFPSESARLALGRYFVFLVNPDGQAAVWLITENADGGARMRRGTVEVRDIPPPRITSIAPARPDTANAGTLTVNGEDFVEGAQVSLVAPDGTLCPATSTDNVDGQVSTQLVAQLNVAAAEPCGIGAGDFFLVRVTNPDGQYGEYASLHIYSNEKGKLGAFTASTADAELAYARGRHDSTVTFDDVGGSSLVVGGGEGRLAGTADPVAPILEVERTTVTPFGKLAPFAVLQTATDDGTRVPNTLSQARRGAQLVTVSNWVYAIGGMDGNGAATATVDRATILTAATMAGAGHVEAAGQGQLPDGVFHYRVAAVLPGGAERFAGEGLASRPIRGRAENNGALGVVFEAYPGAVAYRLYRSPAPGAGAGSVRLVARGALGTAVAGQDGLLRFVDDGSAALLASPGGVSASAQDGGALPAGFYGYRITAVRPDGATTYEAPAGPAVVGQTQGTQNTLRVTWAAVPGATAYRVYRTPSTGLTGSVNDAARTAYRVAEVTGTELVDDGSATPGTETAPDGEPPLPRGALSRFAVDDDSALNVARQGHEVVKLVLGATLAEVHLYALGGRDGAAGTTYGDIEHATVDANGHLAWSPVTFNNAPVELISARANFALVTNAGSRSAPSADPPPNDVCLNPDVDGDGYRSADCGGTDCNDGNGAINPGATEVCDDGLDNDCDGLTDGADPDCAGRDAGPGPGDGGVAPGDGGVVVGPDGGVVAPDAGPGCNDPAFADADNDGFRKTACGGTDCDDTSASINPGVFESPTPGDGMCGNGVDEDCSGADEFCFAAVFPTGPWAETDGEAIYLLAVAGSGGVDGNGAEQAIPAGSAQSPDLNNPYAELAFVRTDGSVEEWLPVAIPSNGFNANGYGVEGLLYFNFLYVMGGNIQTGGQRMDRSNACLPTSPDPPCGGVPNATNWESTDLLLTQDSVSGNGLSTNRLYFSTERLFSTLFILGGLDGPTGNPLSSYDSAPE
ncbi:MAG: putative metal-binding motif-containing protein [Myxococcota bacterium]